MLINEVTRTDEIGGLGKAIKKGYKYLTRTPREREIDNLTKQAKKDQEGRATYLRDQWINVAASKGIKFPNPKRDQLKDANGQYTGKTYAQAVQEIEQETLQGDGMEEDNNSDTPIFNKDPAIQSKIDRIRNVKMQWFKEQVYNPDAPVQDLNKGGGYYYSKLRKFLVDNGVRAGTVDKIAKGMYPEVPKLHDKYEAVFDNPKRLIGKHLDATFKKVMQKATDYHGNFYGSASSQDAIAKAKGNIDPDLIDNIKDLSPEQKQALAAILAGGLGKKLVNPDTDPRQQDLPMDT